MISNDSIRAVGPLVRIKRSDRFRISAFIIALFVGTCRCDLPQEVNISWMFLGILLGSFERAMDAYSNGDKINI